MKIFYILLILMGFMGNAAAEVDNKPMLRLNTQMHTAPIKSMSIDAQQRFVVTGSVDKTARVWDLQTGDLLKVLRPPIGKNEKAGVDIVAISPDGNTVAIGKWAKDNSSEINTSNVYLFDRYTGELVKKISELPDIILHLTYSHDGQYLIAASSDTNIYVYKDTSLVHTIKGDGYGEYPPYEHWIDIDKKNRIIELISDNKSIKLYDGQFNVIAKKEAYGISARFNPDGSKIAVIVSYVDPVAPEQSKQQIQVLSGRDLSLLYVVDKKFKADDLNSIAWSKDGQMLLAGGKYTENGSFSMISWSEEGRGKQNVKTISKNTIQDIQTLTNGKIVIIAQDPLLKVFGLTGEKGFTRSSEIADFRNNSDRFLISHDGNVVQFSYEAFGKKPSQFSLVERTLQSPTKGNNLFAPLTSGINIQWKDQKGVKIDNEYEVGSFYEGVDVTFRALAIHPNKMQFALGEDRGGLMLMKKKTNSLEKVYYEGFKWNIKWFSACSSAVWAVNIPKNNKTVVAAFGDGTIRWYRLSDGVELLAFFPHNDGKRWVLWTPSGYYAASAGAEELIGWHVNNGQDRAADFFNVGQFRDQFYRPDIIDLILEKLDENQAVETANAAKKHKVQAAELKLPPVITILQPVDNAEFSQSELTVHYQIRSPSKIKGLRVLIDGVKTPDSKGIAGIVPDDAKTLKIKLSERDVVLSLLAENEHAVSQPSSVRLKWKGKSIETFTIKPKLYILAIGTSTYDSDKIPKLDYAHKDAQDFTNALIVQKDKGLYKDVETKVLLNPNKQAVLEGLEWIEKQPTQHDVAFVFISGHGKNDSNQRYFYLPKDSDHEKLKSTAVAFEEIKNTLENISGKVLLFVDTCHSGNIMGDLVKSKGSAPDIDKLANELSSADKGILVFASSKGTQDSLESHDWKNGAFAKSIIEGLNGKADLNQDNKITSSELDEYLSERVKALTNGKQTPVTGKNKLSQNLPIAIK